MSASSISAQLAPFLPPGSPAIPHTTRILLRLRASAGGSTLGLTPAELGGLVGVSVVLGCERANASDTISLKTVQKLSSASPRVFTSALNKCRAYLAASPQVATRTPTKSGAASASNTPTSAQLSAGRGKKTTPRATRTDLDLSGLKRTPKENAVASSSKVAASAERIESPLSGKGKARATPAELEREDEDLPETPSKRRRVEAVLPKSPASSRRAKAAAAAAPKGALPEFAAKPQQVPDVTYTPMIPVAPHLSVPRPAIALHGTSRALYEPPEHAASALVAQVLAPPPTDTALRAQLGLHVDARVGDDGQAEEEEVRAYLRAEGRRHARMEQLHDRDGAVDERFWAGFERRRRVDPQAGQDGEEVAFEHAAQAWLNRDDAEGDEQNGLMASWEDRIDEYLKVMSLPAEPGNGYQAGQIASNAEEEEEEASHLPPPPPSVLARAMARKQAAARTAGSSGKKGTQANGVREEQAIAVSSKTDGAVDTAWLARAEMRGIAVRVWTE